MNIGPKIVSKIPVSKTHFEQYVKYEYEHPNLERNELCDEKLKIAFSSLISNDSPGCDGISSNTIIKYHPLAF